MVTWFLLQSRLQFRLTWIPLLRQNVGGRAAIASDQHLGAHIDVRFYAFRCMLNLFFAGWTGNFSLTVASMLVEVAVAETLRTKRAVYSHLIQMRPFKFAYFTGFKRLF